MILFVLVMLMSVLQQGWTALMFAAYRGHTSTINAILLHPEVDVNVKNNVRSFAALLFVKIIKMVPC